MLGPVLGVRNIREIQPPIVGSVCSVNTQAHQSIRQFQKEEGAVLKADRVWWCRTILMFQGTLGKGPLCRGLQHQ